jgi:tetratricopeptide (TPR) repeat protein
MDKNRPTKNKTGDDGAHAPNNEDEGKTRAWFALKLERWATIAESCRKLMTSTLLLALFTILTIVVVDEIMNDSIIIEPIHIPQSLEQQGLTSEIVSLQLIDGMRRIHEEAWTAKKNVSARTDSRQADIEVPGTKTTLKAIINYIRNIFNLNKETRISGEILLINKTKNSAKTTNPDEEGVEYQIRLRIQGKTKTENFEIINKDMNHLLYVAAQKITHITDPIIYACHQFFQLDSIEGRPALEEIIATYSLDDSNESKAWVKYFQGVLFERDGKFKKAQESFKEAIKLYPELADAYNDLAIFYSEMNNYDKAEEILEKGTSEIGDDRLKSFLYFRWSYILESPYYLDESRGKSVTVNLIESPGNVGKVTRRTGNGGEIILDARVEQIKGASARDMVDGRGVISKSPSPGTDKSPQKKKQGQTISKDDTAQSAEIFLEEAQAKCKEAIRLHADSSFAHAQEGRIFYKMGMAQKAREKFELAIRLGPIYERDIYNLWGWAILNQSKIVTADIVDDAIKKFQKAKELKDDSTDTLVNLGYAYFYQYKSQQSTNPKDNSFTAGESSFQKARESHHDPMHIVYEWGKALSEIGRLSDAIKKFEEASKERPENVRYHLQYGNALYKQNEPEGAATEYNHAVRLDPGNPDLYNYWGVALYEIEQWAEAAEKYQKAIDLNKEVQVALYHANLGDALYKANRPVDAEKAYAKAVELEPGNAGRYNRWGNTFYAMERWEEAAKKYQEAIRINPAIGTYHANLGDVLYMANKPEDAEKAFAKAVELEPGNADHYNRWGNTFYAMERWEEAAKKYQEAIRINPKFVVYYENLGYVLYMANKPEDGDKAFSKADELRHSGPIP